MPEARAVYGTPITLTLGLANLANSASLVAGRESTVVINTTTKWEDFLVSLRIRTGSVAPTNNTTIEVWFWACINDSGPVYPANITGADANITFTSVRVKESALKHVQTITVDATANLDYFVSQVSVRDVFGFVPAQWGVVVLNGTGQALNASNHLAVAQPVRTEFA